MSDHAPAYQRVEATRAWVRARLYALAANLRMPGPTLDSFLFTPDERFYGECTGSIVSLQRATRRLIEHLGLACDRMVVGFRANVPFAGRIDRDGGDWFVEIDSRFRQEGPALGAILAHELCHVLMAEQRIPHFGTAVDEVHVDLAVILAGLGALTLNAIKREVRVVNGQRIETRQGFGYLRGYLLRHAYGTVASSLGLGGRRATMTLRSANDRLATRLQLAGHVLRRPAPLGYAPPDDQVVVPCASPNCERRLRVPVGKTGTARCPECGTAAPFDGTPCRVRPLGTPEIMRDRDAALPRQTRALRLRGAIADAPPGRKAAIGLLVAIPCALGSVAMLEHLNRGTVGAQCKVDDDCSESLCLYQSRDMLDGEPVDSYCTHDCQSDKDCPADYTCDSATAMDEDVVGDTYQQRVCVRE
jgi:hypothetical protein